MVLMTINVPHEIRECLQGEGNKSALISRLLGEYFNKNSTQYVNILLEKRKALRGNVTENRAELREIDLKIKEIDTKSEEIRKQDIINKQSQARQDIATNELKEALLEELAE